MRLFTILSLLLLTACADIPDDETIDCVTNSGSEWKDCFRTPTPNPTDIPSTPTVSPTVTKTAVPEKTVTPKPSATPAKTSTPTIGLNPVCSGVMDSRAHLLYKPVSDTSGNAVVVFDGKYKGEFRSVKIDLVDGSKEELFWKPLKLWGNPDKDGERQHWRSKNKCQKILNGALIYADDGYQICMFALPKQGSCKRYE